MEHKELILKLTQSETEAEWNRYTQMNIEEKCAKLEEKVQELEMYISWMEGEYANNLCHCQHCVPNHPEPYTRFASGEAS